MNRPTVTIGIPFLNARRTLTDAVRSVFAQTFDDWELLLVDDGSTDGSLELARSLDDPRVRVISDGTNRGLCERLNQIATLAQGEWLARMDADDLMHPRRIERQVAFLQAQRDVDVVDTALCTVDDNLAPLGIRGMQPPDCRPEAVLRKGLMFHPAVMARRAWFRAHPYDADYVRAEDRELWCRTCNHSRFARLCEPLLFYREGITGNLGNYLRSANTVRQVLRVYGPAVLGSWRMHCTIARLHAQGWAYRLAALVGLQGCFIRRRNRALTASEKHAAWTTLSEILCTRLPGVDRPLGVGVA